MPPINSAVSRSESGWSLRKSRLADVCSQRIELLLLLLLLLAGCNLNTPGVAQARIKRWMRREASTQLPLLLLLLQPVTA